jgi:hypothetical protein
MRPVVAIGPAGGFSVWEDNATDPSGLGIRARRLDGGFSPVGTAFQVNQSMGGNQQHAQITLLQNGGACLVWECGGQGSQYVYARFIDASGAFTSNEILVNQPAGEIKNSYTTNWVLIHNNKPHVHKQKIRELLNTREDSNVNPGVVTLADGSLVVVYSSSRKVSLKKGFTLSETITWNAKKSILVTNRTRVPFSYNIDYMQDVYFQRLSAAGAKLGGETVANSVRQYNQRNGSVAALSGGGFVVCWLNEVPGTDARVDSRVSLRGGGRVDVVARVFGADGQPTGAEFLVNTITMPCGAPVVTGRSGGGFTVAWVQRDSVQSNGLDVWFRAFDAVASPEGAPVLANSRTYGDQFSPAITTIGQQQLLVWSSMGQDGSWEGVYGKTLEGGAAVGEEFRINTTTHLRQVNPAVASSGRGAVVVWSSYAFDSGFDLLAQRYSAP